MATRQCTWSSHLEVSNNHMDLTLSLGYQSRRLSIWCHTDVAGASFEWESSFILMGCGLILTRNWPTWHGHGNIVTFLAISWCGSGLIQTWTYTHQYCIWHYHYMHLPSPLVTDHIITETRQEGWMPCLILMWKWPYPHIYLASWL